VLLAGVLLKTGAYGLIRFVLHLFPQASMEFAPVAATLGVFSILYGAKMAFAQQDLKRLIAYSSISHMGFVMLALFSFNAIAYQGAVLTLVAHGLSSAALFALAGMVYSRVHSRDLNDMGGFWHSAPRMGGFALAFAAAAFGLPGLANFVAEFLSLVGAYQRFPLLTILAALGLIGSAVYGMVFFQGAFYFKNKKVNDLEKLKAIKEHRKEVYYGSKMHFIRSLYNNELKKEGYKVLGYNRYKFNYDSIMTHKKSHYINIKNHIKISYRGYQESNLFQLTDSIYIAKNGYNHPYGIFWTGYMGSQRLSDLLPFEYNPTKD